jgi:hypothetical protein
VDNRYKLKKSNSKQETLIGSKDSNRKAGKLHALVDQMVGVVLRIADDVGGGGRVHPLSSHPDRCGILLDLRGGPQFEPHTEFDTRPTPVFHGRRAARRKSSRETLVRGF